MNISFKKNRIIAVILAMFIIASSVLGFFGKIDSYAEDVSIVLAIWPTDVQVGDAVTATVTITGESLGEFDIFLEFPEQLLQLSYHLRTKTQPQFYPLQMQLLYLYL